MSSKLYFFFGSPTNRFPSCDIVHLYIYIIMYNALSLYRRKNIKINSILEIFKSSVNLYRVEFSINGIYVFRFGPTISQQLGRKDGRKTTSRIDYLNFRFYNRRLPEYRVQLFAIFGYLSYNISYIHMILHLAICVNRVRT